MLSYRAPFLARRPRKPAPHPGGAAPCQERVAAEGMAMRRNEPAGGTLCYQDGTPIPPGANTRWPPEVAHRLAAALAEAAWRQFMSTAGRAPAGKLPRSGCR